MRRFVETVAARRLRHLHRARAQCGAERAVARRTTARCRRCATPRCYRLKREFPELAIVVNGGIDTLAAGRRSSSRTSTASCSAAPLITIRMCWRERRRAAVRRARPSRSRAWCDAMHDYATEQVARGTPLRAIARHMLGLYHGQPRARPGGRCCPTPQRLARNDPDLLLDAAARVAGPVAAAA